MKAVNHYLIIDMIKEEPTKVGGLILTEETDKENRYAKAKVISIDCFHLFSCWKLHNLQI